LWRTEVDHGFDGNGQPHKRERDGKDHKPGIERVAVHHGCHESEAKRQNRDRADVAQHTPFGASESQAAECKHGDADPDRGIRYLRGKFPAAEAWQISATGRKDYVTGEGIRVAPALALLETLV